MPFWSQYLGLSRDTIIQQTRGIDGGGWVSNKLNPTSYKFRWTKLGLNLRTISYQDCQIYILVRVSEEERNYGRVK